jgi:tRNA(Ile2) C34 agmatinyltransferase TiaS
VIYIGIDDTDIIGTPGTNQLARAILKSIGRSSQNAVITRHQLFFDPRVPYTSKNGSASILLPHVQPLDLPQITETIRDTMRSWFVPGSDPGLCVASHITREMKAFGLRCKTEVVTQSEAREMARRDGCYLEGLGGTEQGIIGALAGVGLIADGEDGRVVHLASWPYPDEYFSGPRTIEEISGRGVQEIRQLASNELVTCGPVDIGKHLRPNWRGGKIVLLVNSSSYPDSAALWQAVKIQ